MPNKEDKVFIYLNDGSVQEHIYETIKFPSHEFQVRLDVNTLPEPEDISWIEVVSCWGNYYSIAQLLWSFKSYYVDVELDYALTVLYTPFARQDRVCNKGECASVHIALQALESIGFDFVYVLDIHNKESLKGYNIINLDKEYVFKLYNERFEKSFLDEYDTLLAPDKGAEEQVKMLAKAFKKDFVSCSKERDPMTGKLSGFTLNGSVKGKKVLIVDDILDGCGTFLGIHELLGEAEKVSLYGTHGLFTKGVDIATDVFHNVCCTNSFYNSNSESPHNLTVIDVITPRKP